jgi:hypothetical protein
MSESINVQQPLPMGAAWRAVGRCVVTSARLLWQRRVHLPRARVGLRMRFADGTTARVYRETVVDRPEPEEPCVLVVEFRLRAVRGWGHALFRGESLLNTPLFVGFPGLVSKLWMAHDERGSYRGVYQWDGAAAAQAYARALWRVLALVSEPASIHYRVLPGLRRDDLLAGWQPPDAAEPAPWWCPVDMSSVHRLTTTLGRCDVGVRPGASTRGTVRLDRAPCAASTG